MFNAGYSENTFLTHPTPAGVLRIVKDENEVKRVVPYLQPVASIVLRDTGPHSGRPEADIYSLPDGQLVRLRLKGDNTYDYDNATLVPQTHPAYLASQNKPNECVTLSYEDDKERGPRAEAKDIAWLKSTIESQVERARKEIAAQSLNL